MINLDISSLEKAIFQLESALKYCDYPAAKHDAQLAWHLRAGAIQAFEFTYELFIKLLRRFFEMTESNPAAASEMSFQDLIREGYDKGLLCSELVIWKEYRRERGTTSQTYDGIKAENVFEQIPSFLKDVQYLFAQLRFRTLIS